MASRLVLLVRLRGGERLNAAPCSYRPPAIGGGGFFDGLALGRGDAKRDIRRRLLFFLVSHNSKLGVIQN